MRVGEWRGGEASGGDDVRVISGTASPVPTERLCGKFLIKVVPC
jgi:hypothetical protein